jgi:hypothetical protein
MTCEECKGGGWLERKRDSAPVACWACDGPPDPEYRRNMAYGRRIEQIDAIYAGLIARRAAPVSCPEEPQGLLVCTECGGDGAVLNDPWLRRFEDEDGIQWEKWAVCSACLGAGTLVAPISIIDEEAAIDYFGSFARAA